MAQSATNYLFLLSLLLHSCCASERTLRTFLNPDCDTVCTAKNVTTVYLRADGQYDTLHYLWDFVGNPSVLLAVTSPSAQLRINWDDYLVNIPQSVNFTEEPRYTFGIVLQKVFEFNDVNDTGLVDTIPRSNINVLNTKFFKWLRKNIENNTRFVELHMDSDGYSDPATNTTRNGNMQIMLNGFCNLDHSDVMPHMLHSENSTQVDIIFNNFETNSTFSNSRFGMELLLVSDGKPDVSMTIDEKKSLDDEHTPGIFEVVELRTPYVKIESGNENAAAYMQWRPISYTAPTRGVTDTTETIYYPLSNVTGQPEIAGNSLLYAYYGERMNRLLVEKIKITLGTKGDGFYKKSNYTTWTFIVGYGTPPAERFSYLVIMIISIGLGLPTLIMLAMGIYFCARRSPKRQRTLFVNSSSTQVQHFLL